MFSGRILDVKEKRREGVFIVKEKYETPVCEVIEFETEDIITTSGTELGDGGVQI